MKLSLKIKTVLFLVLFAAWCSVLDFTASSADEVSALSKKQPRKVVMLDAWSYSSGNSREGYEGRFADDETGIHFTYRIEAHVYHAYAKKLTPETMVLMLSKDAILGRNSDALLLGVTFLSMALAFTPCFFLILQFGFYPRKSGMVYDWVEYIKSRKK